MGTVKRRQVSVRALTGGLMSAIMMLTCTGCSSNQAKPMVQPTPEQVRGHADRAFDKLKQEEQERASQPPAAQ